MHTDVAMLIKQMNSLFELFSYLNTQNQTGLWFVRRYFVQGIERVKDYRIVELKGLSLWTQKVVLGF